MAHIGLGDGNGVAALAGVQRHGFVSGVAGLIGEAGVLFAYDLVGGNVEACGNVADADAVVHHVLIGDITQTAFVQSLAVDSDTDHVVDVLILLVAQGGIFRVGVPAESAGTDKVSFVQNVAAAEAVAAFFLHQLPLGLGGFLDGAACGSVTVFFLVAAAEAEEGVLVLFFFTFVGGFNGALVIPFGICGDHASGFGLAVGGVDNVAYIIGIGSRACRQNANVAQTQGHCQGQDPCQGLLAHDSLCHYFVLLSRRGAKHRQPRRHSFLCLSPLALRPGLSTGLPLINISSGFAFLL